jgi:hypothetical protein
MGNKASESGMVAEGAKSIFSIYLFFFFARKRFAP